MISLCKKLKEYLIKLNQLFVKTSGNENGESLVMIHGWGMNSGAWEPVRAELEVDYHITWIDLPGYGENSEVVADNLEEIVDLILPSIPENSHLMGWSLGGLIAQAIAEKLHVDNLMMLKSVTLVATSPKFSQSDDWDSAVSHETLDNFSNNLQADVEGTLKRFVALQFMGVAGSKAIQKSIIDQILLNSQYKSGKKGGGGSEKLDETTHLKALKLGLTILKEADFRKVSYPFPQHWVLADRDRLIPPTMINDLMLLRPNDPITLLDDAGHAPFMTHPENFVSVTVPFLQSFE